MVLYVVFASDEYKSPSSYAMLGVFDEANIKNVIKKLW